MLEPKLDQKFENNPVVPKPKLPSKTIINLNPDFVSKSQPISDTEVYGTIIDFKKIINDSLTQGKNIITTTVQAIKTTESRIQSRFKNELVALGKVRDDLGKKNVFDNSSSITNNNSKDEPKPKKAFFEIPKLKPKQKEKLIDQGVVTKKSELAQGFIVAGLFSILFICFSLLFSFVNIVSFLGLGLKSIQYILACVFLVSSTVGLLSHTLLSNYGYKKMYFVGLVFGFLGSAGLIFAPNYQLFFVALALISISFAGLMTTSLDLFFYNSGLNNDKKAKILLDKLVVLTSIAAAVIAGTCEYFLSWRWSVGFAALVFLIIVLNTNRLSAIKELPKSKPKLINVFFFVIANVLILWGLIESQYYGLFGVKNQFFVNSFSVNSVVSVSLIGVLSGFLILGFRNMMTRDEKITLQNMLSGLIGFFSSGLFGSLLGVMVFGVVVFAGLATDSGFLSVILGVAPVLIGLVVSTVLSKGLNARISFKNNKLLGLLIFILGLIMLYFSLLPNVGMVTLVPPLLIIGLGAGLYLFTYFEKDNLYTNFTSEFSKLYITAIIGMVFFWSFGSSFFSSVTNNTLIPNSSKAVLTETTNGIKNLNLCKLEKYENDPKQNPLHTVICNAFKESIIEGNKSAITIATLVTVILFTIVLLKKN